MNNTLAATQTGANLLSGDFCGEPPQTGWLQELFSENRRHEGRHCQAKKSGILLVPLSLSKNSPATLATANTLAFQTRSRLVLLHAVELNIAGEEHGFPRTELLNDMCLDAESRLNELIADSGLLVPAKILVCAGRPADVIVETARRLNADAIVMQTGRTSFWSRWFHRNTALNVANRARCKMWLVA
jgi:nucleotide-binding universal stress UspA family protein